MKKLKTTTLGDDARWLFLQLTRNFRWMGAEDFTDQEIIEGALIEPKDFLTHCTVCEESPYWCRIIATQFIVRRQSKIHPLEVKGGALWLANDILRSALVRLKLRRKQHDL